MKKDISMKRIGLLLLSVILCLIPLSGCGNQGLKDSHCEILDDDLGAKPFQEAFLKENRTKNAYYDDTEVDHEALPRSKVFIIRTQADFEAVFSESAEAYPVDFSSEMLVLCTFTTVYHREIKLTELKTEDGALTIGYEMKVPSLFFGVGDAAQPFQRFMLLKMDQLEVDSGSVVDTSRK